MHATPFIWKRICARCLVDNVADDRAPFEYCQSRMTLHNPSKQIPTALLTMSDDNVNTDILHKANNQFIPHQSMLHSVNYHNQAKDIHICISCCAAKFKNLYISLPAPDAKNAKTCQSPPIYPTGPQPLLMTQVLSLFSSLILTRMVQHQPIQS